MSKYAAYIRAIDWNYFSFYKGGNYWKEETMPLCMGKRYFIIDTAIAIEKMRRIVPGLDEYLVGIDAASEENAMEPWMFAQAYRMMRLHLYTKPEIEVYQKLQAYLIRKVEKKGIYLEANPTSNLTIGDFSQIRNHPIFQLDSIRNQEGNHSMMIVNSDNPTIFNTNVESELAYIYYAADEFGYSKSEILEWIDRIRQRGMDASFIKSEKDALQILSEIQEMMDYIKKNNL